MADDTPIKTSKVLSSEGDRFCITCQEEIHEAKDRVRLLDNQKNLTDNGNLFERLVGVKITFLDFPTICQNCWRKINRIEQKLKVLNEGFQKGKETSKKFIEVKVKRCLKSVSDTD